MKHEIKVPAMGESINEAIVGEILKPSGSQVEADEEILELETDKVNQVLYAPQKGVIQYNVKTDDVVKIGQVLGFVDSEGVQQEPQKEAPPPFLEEPQKEKVPPVQGGGVRISKEEAIQSFKEPVAAPQVAQTSVDASKQETRKRMTSIRKVIAARLVESKQTTAMLTTFNEIDMSEVMALRSRLKDEFIDRHGVKLGFMSFFVKACVFALKQNPELNSYIDGEEIVHREYFDIGIAVGTKRGLVVPVVRGCEQLSFSDIEQSIANFAEKAKTGGLTAQDLQGGGFTITNGGVYGSLLSTPILNPPQCGILGMHKIEKRAVVVKDEVVVRPMMYLALSYDHRIVDGKEAVTFLVRVKEAIEDPHRLLLEM